MSFLCSSPINSTNIKTVALGGAHEYIQNAMDARAKPLLPNTRAPGATAANLTAGVQAAHSCEAGGLMIAYHRFVLRYPVF